MNLKKASWVVLAGLASFILFVSFVSMYISHFGDYQIGGVDVADVASGRAGLENALRGIRGTSAAYAAGYGLFFLVMVLVPYRRGEVWAWWTLLAAVVLPSLMVFLRIPVFGTTLGVQAGAMQLVIGVAGLLLDVARLGNPSKTS
jgi:hypothetical protein